MTAVRSVSRWEAMRRAWAGWRLWGAKGKKAEPRNSQAVRIQRQRERARWLRQWLRWEGEVQARHQAQTAGAGEEPNIPPPPPEGTPEYREWEERYAHVLYPYRPPQPQTRAEAQENKEDRAPQPPRWDTPWMDDWGTWKRDYEGQNWEPPEFPKSGQEGQEEGGKGAMEPTSWLPEERFPDLPLALAAGGRFDRPHITSRWGLGLLQWGMTTSAELASQEAPLIEGGTMNESGGFAASKRVMAHLGPLQLVLEATPNRWGGRDYRVEGVWMRPLSVGREGAGSEVQVGWSAGLEWEALGPGYVLNRALRWDYHPVVYQSRPTLPGLPVSEARQGYYVKWMPARTAAVVVFAVIIVKLMTTSPLWIPALIGAGG